MKIAKLNLIFGAAVAFVCIAGSTASADFLEDFRTNQTAAFRFGAYTEANSTFDSEGLQLAIDTGTDDNFGGIGIAPILDIDLSELTSIQVTARLNADNAADLTLSFRENGNVNGEGEFFSFTVSQSEFTQGEFVTFTIDDLTSGFNGDNDREGADGVLNGFLNNTGIQSPFGQNFQQNYTIQSVNYVGAVAIPEPGSLALLGGLSSLLVFRRRR